MVRKLVLIAVGMILVGLAFVVGRRMTTNKRELMEVVATSDGRWQCSILRERPPPFAVVTDWTEVWLEIAQEGYVLARFRVAGDYSGGQKPNFKITRFHVGEEMIEIDVRDVDLGKRLQVVMSLPRYKATDYKDPPFPVRKGASARPGDYSGSARARAE